jgi:hypothetical protein
MMMEASLERLGKTIIELRTSGILAKDRNLFLPHTSLKPHHYTNLLGTSN